MCHLQIEYRDLLEKMLKITYISDDKILVTG